MRLTLVRHAHPAWPDGPSQADPGLSVRGQRQAEATAALLAARFHSRPVVWSGPSHRTLETARLIVAALDASLVVQDALQGLADAELRLQLDARRPSDSLLAELERLQGSVWGLVESLLAADEPPADAVFVSHDAAISSLVCRALTMDLQHLARFRIDLASVTTIDFRPQRTILASLNETHHLDPLPAE